MWTTRTKKMKKIYFDREGNNMFDDSYLKQTPEP